MTEHYVWYASYGSNLLIARFDCYLKGKKMAGQRHGCQGARNPADPIDVLSLDVPHRLFFAHESPRWGGGVVFLDPRPDRTARSRLRMYKITLEQFNDVLAQENRSAVPPPPSMTVTPSHLARLARTDGITFWDTCYGYLKLLGHHDGCPVLTFTCTPEHANRASKGVAPWHFNMPSEAYARVIKSGLTESGMSAGDAQAYLLRAMMQPWVREHTVASEARVRA